MYARIIRPIIFAIILSMCIPLMATPGDGVDAMDTLMLPRTAKVVKIKVTSIKIANVVSDTTFNVDQKYLIKPYKRLDFHNFADSVKMRESSGNYTIINKWGYAGAYQFGKAALNDLGIKNKTAFIKCKELQDAAFVGYVMINKYRLRKYIVKYVGNTINGILVTESGICAAAHLKGAGNVRAWLKHDGKISDKKMKDALNTSLEEYMKRFGGYDISSVPAVKKVKIKLG